MLERLRILYGLDSEGWREAALGNWPDEARVCLFRRLALKGDGAGAAEALHAWPEVSPVLAAEVLETAFGPAAPLLHLGDFPARVLELLGRSPAWSRFGDAVADALAAAARFRWPRAMAQRLVRFRALAAGAGLAERMRRVQELDRMHRLFLRGAPMEVLRALAREAARLPLDAATVRVALAHAAALSRLDPGSAPIARRLLANVARWRREAARIVQGWAASASAERGAGAAAEPPAGHAEHLALVELNRGLGAAVEDASRGRASALPWPLHLERAMNDLGLILAERVAPRWGECPEVLAPLLRVLCGTRGLRLRLRPVLRHALEDPRQPESVQRAAVRLGASFLSGLGAFDAWAAVEARHEVSGRTEGLQAEQKLIVEADRDLRGLLEGVAGDAARPAAVRSDALLALLRCALSADELRRLAELGVRGDEPLARAVLRWAARSRAHSALEPLRELHARRQELCPAMRRRLFRALAATGHAAAPEVLSADVLAGSPDARRALAMLGAPLRARQLTSEVQVGRWTAALARHDRRCRSLSRRASASRAGALRLALSADAAAIEAAGHGAAGHAAAAEMQAECAAFELSLAALMQRLEESLAERNRLDAACQRRLAEVRALHARLEGSRRELDGLVGRVREEEGRAASLERQAAETERRLAELRREAAEAAVEISRLSGARASAAERLRALCPTDREGRQRVGRDLAALDARRAELERALAQVRARLSSLPEMVQALRDGRDQAVARAEGLERRAAELRRGLGPLVGERERLEDLARESRAELQGLDASILRLRDRCAEVRGRVEEASRRFAALLQERAERLEEALLRQERLRAEADSHLRQGRLWEERFTGHALAAVRLDQQVAEQLAAMQRTIPEAAEEVAELDRRSARAESLAAAVRRRSAELRLNLDLLLHFLGRFEGPTPEARVAGRHAGIDWAAARVGDLTAKGEPT